MHEKKYKVGVYAGSFNPPHIGHMTQLEDTLKYCERTHLLVRYNEGVDLTDWETKEEWFRKLTEKFGGRIIVHKMSSGKIKSKKYRLNTVREGFRKLTEVTGEPIDVMFAGEDYRGLKRLMIFLACPRLHVIISPRTYRDGVIVSSTLIRSDIEGHKDWLPACVYESLKELGLCKK